MLYSFPSDEEADWELSSEYLADAVHSQDVELTEGQTPSPEPREVLWGVFERKGSTDECDVGMVSWKRVVVMVHWTSLQLSYTSVQRSFEGACTEERDDTHVLQFPDKFAPRRLHTRPYASTTCRPCT